MTFYVYQRGSPLADSSWSLFSLLKVKLSGGAATVQKGKKKNNDLPGGDAVQTPKWQEIPRAVSLTPGPPENDLHTDCLERMQRESFFQERNYSQSSSEQERALQDWEADPPWNPASCGHGAPSRCFCWVRHGFASAGGSSHPPFTTIAVIPGEA